MAGGGIMLRLVVYDIADSRRLAKVARICGDYGVRVERSVFECDLDDEAFDRFWGKLAKTVDAEKDRLIVYGICVSCVKRIQFLGSVARPEKPLLYVV